MIFNISQALGKFSIKKLQEAQEREDVRETKLWLLMGIREYERVRQETKLKNEDEDEKNQRYSTGRPANG